MIIRLTINNDNDFTSYLENYLKDIYNNILCDLVGNPGRYIPYEQLIRAILNPNCSSEWTPYEQEILIQRIKESFAYYVNNDNYMASNLKISILKSFEDQWENYEVVYWLQHSNLVITQ